MISAVELYDAQLTSCSRAGGGSLRARLDTGAAIGLPLARWLSPVTAIDQQILARVLEPVIDIGCSPGRHLQALARRGVPVLGVDVSAVAVAIAHCRGARAIRASVFDELPGSGRWRTALLLDGNIGIGGDPAALLAGSGTC